MLIRISDNSGFFFTLTFKWSFFMTTGIFKRTALVAALATTGVVAQADTLPFSFYALLDAGVVSTKISGGTAGAGNTTEVRSSPIDPSFWGIVAEKKVDDLIGGIQMESTINTTNYSGTDTGNHNALADRQANVYVKSDSLGKLEMGRITDPVFDALLTIDPTSSGFGNTLSPWFQVVGHSSDTGAIKYSSPVIGGFSAKVSYVAASASPTIGGNNSTYGTGVRAALNYNYGDFNLVGAYESNNAASTFSTVTIGQNQNSVDLLGANYKVGAVTLKAIYLVNKDNAQLYSAGSINTTDYGSMKTTGFGGSYDFSEKLQLTGGYYQSKDGGSAKTNGTNVSAFDAYLTYEFIKDLKVYGQVANVQDNGTAASGAFAFSSNYGTFAGSNNGFTTTGAITAGQSAKVLSVGLHYGFF